ncbi:MAG: APC family permease [Ruminococcaceae bacterium]|nr:APC family permease [Oscillospiraceae bacterium]
MLNRIRDLLLGKPLKDSELANERLSIFWGVPVFSSDTISTVTYAGEEILLVLIPILGAAAYREFFGIVCALIALLVLLVLCYTQTIDAYPQGGGAYAVALDNLGERAGLVAGASLIIGYVLIVAVSASAAAAAVTSAIPGAAPYKLWIALALTGMLTWLHLRGTRTAAIFVGIPTYLFVLTIIIMVAVGLFHWYSGNYPVPVPHQEPVELTEPVIFLLLRAFAAGCTALSGIEAVSNGVANFKEPSYRTAKGVLIVMGVIVGSIFLGTSRLISLYRIVPGELATTFSMIASTVFGYRSAMYYTVQIMTVVILALAANTAFADLPHLMAMMAEDHYLPRRMIFRGSRLNYSNGILFLLAASAVLIIAFNADQHRLLPLYASGVFISFFLNQLGMLRWQCRKRLGASWGVKALINAVALCVTSVTLTVLILTQFMQGAWVTLGSIALQSILMMRICRHYRKVRRELAVDSFEDAQKMLSSTRAGKAILPVHTLNRAFIKAYNCAQDMGFSEIELYYVGSSEEEALELKSKIEALELKCTFAYEITEYRNTEDLLIRHIEEADMQLKRHQHLTVVLPNLVTRNPFRQYLHNETSHILVRRMARYRYVYIFQVPYLFE